MSINGLSALPFALMWETQSEFTAQCSLLRCAFAKNMCGSLPAHCESSPLVHALVSCVVASMCRSGGFDDFGLLPELLTAIAEMDWLYVVT